ncbi:MAG: outer membrane protein assembly factor BamE [Gammaproteobacteria bacterium]|nr:outer membrane protein assembly factor BamE [Gammaproteobacteria bacterium]
MSVLLRVLLISLLIVNSGCNFWIKPYRPDINQGNVLNEDDIKSLKIGMSKEQVLFLMGKPVLATPFETNRWNYIHYLKPGYKDAQIEQLQLYFKGDALERIERNKTGPDPETAK